MNRIFKIESYDYWEKQILKVLDIIGEGKIYLSRTNPSDPDIVITIRKHHSGNVADNEIFISDYENERLYYSLFNTFRSDPEIILTKSNSLKLFTRNYDITFTNYMSIGNFRPNKILDSKIMYSTEYLIKEFIEDTLNEEK